MVSIRVMTVDDYGGVYELWTSTPGMGLNSTDDSREGIDKYLKRNPGMSFVAEDNGMIIGTVLSGHDGRRGYVQHLAVAQGYRHRGIGRKLVDNVMHAMDGEGIKKVALVAFSKNEEGNAFWEKLGFSARGDLIYRNKAVHELEYYPNPFAER